MDVGHVVNGTMMDSHRLKLIRLVKRAENNFGPLEYTGMRPRYEVQRTPMSPPPIGSAPLGNSRSQNIVFGLQVAHLNQELTIGQRNSCGSTPS